MFRPIRVLVVDDSALIRQLLTRAISLDPRIEVVGTAATGVDAVEKTRELKPDVITLDVRMPELDGLETLPFLAKQTDARVIMLTAQDDSDTAYAALSAGAVDFISKPKGGFASSLSDLADLLIKKIKTAYRAHPVSAASVIEADEAQGGVAVATAAERASELECLVTIAASTGGPPALEALLADLSVDVEAAYLVVQHLPAGFAESLVRRLARGTELRVVEASDGARVEPATAYLAPHGMHMTVGREGNGLVLELTDGPLIHGVKPSADPLFESAAENFDSVIGIVLTGMGADGVEGLKAIRQRGGLTIAQDEDTSVVWGMPGAAVREGVAMQVMPLDRIASEVRRTVIGKAGGESRD